MSVHGRRAWNRRVTGTGASGYGGAHVRSVYVSVMVVVVMVRPQHNSNCMDMDIQIGASGGNL